MTAVLGTLPFIATLWLLVVLGAVILEESGAKIVIALKGKSMRHSSAGAAPGRPRARSLNEKAIRATVQWRVAA